MALTDFLTEGAQIPEGSALKATTSQTILPQFYTDYATQLLANQQALGTQPYTPYQGPRVAGFTQPQQQGFQMAGQAATAYQPALGQATQATQNLLGQSGAFAQPLYTAALGAAGNIGQTNKLITDSINTVMTNTPGVSSNAQALAGQNIGLQAAQPYLNQARDINGSATAQPFYTQAGTQAQQATQNGALQVAQPLLGQAAGINSSQLASPYFSQAGDLAAQGTQQSGLSVAQPYLNSAAGDATDVSAYMNPYTDSVVSRIADLGTRNLTENLLPQIEGRYIGAGQWNGSGKMTDTARAIRDVQADVLAQQTAALNEGYTQAQAAKQADLARQAQLGSTAGGLGTAQQQALLAAGGLKSQVGAQMGQLEQARQNALGQLAGTTGGLASDQQKALLEAAGLSANIGTAAGGLAQQRANTLGQLGSIAAGTGNAQLDALLRGAGIDAQTATASAQIKSQGQQAALSAALGLGNLGVNQITGLGGLANNAASTSLGAAGQLGNLGSLSQSLGLAGAGALGEIGKQQQGLNQQNLDVAYSDFLRQQGYPQSQIDAMLGTFKGVATGIPTATQEVGIVPSNDQTYKPSTASTIASALAGAGGLLSAIKGL